MCGITAYVGPEPLPKMVLNYLMLANLKRGKDAAGYYDGNKNRIFKAIGDVNENLLVTHPIEDSSFFIGHCRAATGGFNGTNIANAHPHDFPGIVLVHNGTLTNYYDLKGEIPFDYSYTDEKNKIVKDTCEVDSKYVAWRMYKDANYVPILKEYGGSAALIWGHAIKKGKKIEHTLNFYHDKERPLFKGEYNGGVILHSIEETLKVIGATNVEEVPVLKVYTLNSLGILVSTSKEIERKPFIKNYYNRSTNNNNTIFTTEFEEFEEKAKKDLNKLKNKSTDVSIIENDFSIKNISSSFNKFHKNIQTELLQAYPSIDTIIKDRKEIFYLQEGDRKSENPLTLNLYVSLKTDDLDFLRDVYLSYPFSKASFEKTEIDTAIEEILSTKKAGREISDSRKIALNSLLMELAYYDQKEAIAIANKDLLHTFCYKRIFSVKSMFNFKGINYVKIMDINTRKEYEIRDSILKLHYKVDEKLVSSFKTTFKRLKNKSFLESNINSSLFDLNKKKINIKDDLLLTTAVFSDILSMPTHSFREKKDIDKELLFLFISSIITGSYFGQHTFFEIDSINANNSHPISVINKVKSTVNSVVSCNYSIKGDSSFIVYENQKAECVKKVDQYNAFYRGEDNNWPNENQINMLFIMLDYYIDRAIKNKYIYNIEAFEIKQRILLLCVVAGIEIYNSRNLGEKHLYKYIENYPKEIKKLIDAVYQSCWGDPNDGFLLIDNKNINKYFEVSFEDTVLDDFMTEEEIEELSHSDFLSYVSSEINKITKNTKDISVLTQTIINGFKKVLDDLNKSLDYEFVLNIDKTEDSILSSKLHQIKSIITSKLSVSELETEELLSLIDKLEDNLVLLDEEVAESTKIIGDV